MFEPLSSRFSFPQAEQKVLEFWEKHGIFERSLRLRAGAPRFVFYEGPPTANGLPHPGHCLTRAIKDLFPRYRTMCGYLVERKAGWDTHGLPVEVEVCKELGIHGKEEIEAYGVEKFNLKCIQSVFRYTRQWEELTRRLGFWVNLQDAYVTYHRSYVESVWWSLKTLFERGLLYQGHKVVWWWAQGGTALSSGEVGEGYRTVDDPSAFVKFPLVAGSRDDRAGEAPSRVSLLVWTTTPWTLISNHFAAVHPDLEYALVEDPGPQGGPAEYLYVARQLVDSIAGKLKRPLRVVSTCKGSDLVGLHYLPPFREVYYDTPWADFGDCSMSGSRVEHVPGRANNVCDRTGSVQQPLRAGGRESVGWRVVGGNFVTIESGTGIVHIAPAFGEADFELLAQERARFEHPHTVPLLNAVRPDGTFDEDAPPRYRGRWVRDCDKDILRELRDERKTPWGTPLLYHQELYRHDYPFCPRSENDPLIQYARRSWFVRTSQFKQEFLANNAAINWLPEHIRDGRFGDFLRNNVDWALSRERYWGTPLPIWQCEKCGRMEAIGSFAELESKPAASDGGYWERKTAEHAAAGVTLPEHLRVHKPYIDEWTYRCDAPQSSREKCDGRMRRVPEVIDCWWDAGSMPFAQWGFPYAPGSAETFASRFPADFISEAIDQTRGWFYGLLAINTLLFAVGDGGAAPCARGEPGQKADQAAAAAPAPPAAAARPAATVQSTPGPTGAAAPVRDYPLPFRTCIVLGHIMGEDGLKMSKRKKNYREPAYIFDHYGADAMRWYFFSAQTPWTSVRFQEAAIRDAQREFLVKLYNVLSFFNIYANIDGFSVRPVDHADRRSADHAHAPAPSSPTADPRGTGWRDPRERSELDRWILSELHRTIRAVRESMDRFENYPAAQRLSDFVEALSNWYVRRSRDRFWRPVHSPGSAAGTSPGGRPGPAPTGTQATGREALAACPPPIRDPRDPNQDKWDAYNTLYECLLTLSKLIAPFTPFFAETMYQNLAGVDPAGEAPAQQGTARPPAAGREERDSAPAAGRPAPQRGASAASSSNSPAPQPRAPISVHLCDYPVADPQLMDENLAAEMDLVREIVSLGRAARTEAKLKVRQPLARVEIILARREHEDWLRAHAALIAEELNVKTVEFTTQADHYVHYQVKPNFKAIGPKFGKLAPAIAAALSSLPDPAEARRRMLADDALSLTVDGQELTLTPDDVEIRLQPKPGWTAAQGRAGVVVMSTELTPELREEGLVRELVHHVQSIRKEQDLPYQARIVLYLAGPEPLRRTANRYADTIRGECLAERIEYQVPPGMKTLDLTVEGYAVQLAVVPV